MSNKTNVARCDFVVQLEETLENLASDFELKDLCRAMAMSRASLHRKVTKGTGKYISSYVRYFRLKKAYALLLTTNQPISDIAFSIGFSNLAYFSRCFKEQYGVSAKAIRQKNRGT